MLELGLKFPEIILQATLIIFELFFLKFESLKSLNLLSVIRLLIPVHEEDNLVERQLDSLEVALDLLERLNGLLLTFQLLGEVMV